MACPAVTALRPVLGKLRDRLPAMRRRPPLDLERRAFAMVR